MMTLRTRLSPTVDRFLAGQFFGPFLVCLCAFTAAYLLGDLFDRFDDLLHYGGLGLLGLEYFALKLPLIISQLLPVACLAGVLLGFALLNRSGEVLACQQLGISRLEMAAPVLLIAVLISLFDFGLSQTVVPLATREARYIYEVQLKKRMVAGVFANETIWVHTRTGFLSAGHFDKRNLTLDRVTFYTIGPGYQLQSIVQAKSAFWNGHGWSPVNANNFSIAPDGAVSSGAAVPKTIAAGVKPRDLGMLRLDPDEFSLWELNRYIHGLRREGLNPGSYLVDRDLKLAMPLACLIMVALGVALSLDPLPRHLSLGRSFGLAVLIGFGYWLAFGMTSSLGHSGVLAPWLAAWLPNILFTMLAGSIFLFGEEH